MFILSDNLPYERRENSCQPIHETLQPHLLIGSDGQLYWRSDLDAAGAEGLPADAGGFLWPVLLSYETIAEFLRTPDLFEHVAGRLGLRQLRTAPGFRAQLAFSVSEINAGRVQLLSASQRHDGSRVVAGVVDYGCDFAHPNFRTGPGDGGESRTRLLWLWDQNEGVLTPLARRNGEGRPPRGSDVGREFSHRSLNHALRAADPYGALGYDPDRHGFRYPDPEVPGGAAPEGAGSEEAGAHGTHVMDIAVGNGNASGAPGVAPGAHLVFVHVRAKPFASIAPISPSSVLDGVCYVFWRAQQERLPAVVNLSLNGNSGPHDGRTPLDEAFERLLKRPGRAIVVSAGNYRDAGLHASGTVAYYAPLTLTWRFFQADRTPNQLEIWYESPGGGGGGGATLEAILIAPNGEEIGPIPPDDVRALARGGEHVGLVVGGRGDPWNGPQRIVIRLEPQGREEDWRIRLRVAEARGAAVHFHAWIERDDSGQSRFIDDDAVESCTLGSLGCGERTIVVGAYHGLLDSRKPAHYSSEGPTRDDDRKPDVSAPGHMIWAARSKGYRLRSPGAPWRTAAAVAKSGTSMAAPHVAGVVALLLQRDPELCARAIADTLKATARRPEDDGRDWDARYGYGRVDAAAALAHIASTPQLRIGTTKVAALDGEPARLPIEVALPARSGADTPSVIIEGVPDDLELSAGHTPDGRTWIVPGEQLAGLAIRRKSIPAAHASSLAEEGAGFLSPVRLTVTAVMAAPRAPLRRPAATMPQAIEIEWQARRPPRGDDEGRSMRHHRG